MKSGLFMVLTLACVLLSVKAQISEPVLGDLSDTIDVCSVATQIQELDGKMLPQNNFPAEEDLSKYFSRDQAEKFQQQFPSSLGPRYCNGGFVFQRPCCPKSNFYECTNTTRTCPGYFYDPYPYLCLLISPPIKYVACTCSSCIKQGDKWDWCRQDFLGQCRGQRFRHHQTWAICVNQQQDQTPIIRTYKWCLPTSCGCV